MGIVDDDITRTADFVVRAEPRSALSGQTARAESQTSVAADKQGAAPHGAVLYALRTSQAAVSVSLQKLTTSTRSARLLCRFKVISGQRTAKQSCQDVHNS